MGQNLGTWFYDTGRAQGDTVRLLELAITDPSTGNPWGTAVGTGWTPTLEVRKAGVNTLTATITGTWTDGTEVAATFPIGTTAALVPSDSAPQAYEALVVMTKLGNTSPIPAFGEDRPYEFTVQRWP